MYDYKSLRRVVRMLAIVFGIVLMVLVVTSYPLNPFAWISVLLLAIVGVYLVSLPRKLLKEMEDMEEIINMYKKKN
jgi:uncharacterized membrane protein (DUF106 family)